MAEQGERERAAARGLASVLERFRGYEGITAKRLRQRKRNAEPLLELASVQRVASLQDGDVFAAAVQVVTECVAEMSDAVLRVIADVVLCTGVSRGAWMNAGVDGKLLVRLYGDVLGTRREVLLANWIPLLVAAGASGVQAPSDRHLRGVTESEALLEVGRLLVRRETVSTGSVNAGVRPSVPSADARQGEVIVLGGAVMDATFQVRGLPRMETSTEAQSFTLAPGGKGLTQAIAAARLGMHVRLAAAVGDDRLGEEVSALLEQEGVDTSLLKVVPRGRTPYTGVIEQDLGESIAVNWRNDFEVRLDAGDLEAIVVEMSGAHVVLATFEIPLRMLEAALTALDAFSGDSRPSVVVTPGQPYETRPSASALRQIDDLVTHAWELRNLHARGRFDPDTAARQVLEFGVGTVALLSRGGGGGCSVYSEGALGTFQVPGHPTFYRESSVARDAFCAALARRFALLDGDEPSREIFSWATAAQAATMIDYPAATSMPDAPRIDEMLARMRRLLPPEGEGQDGA